MSFKNHIIVGTTIALFIISPAESSSSGGTAGVEEWAYGYVRDENGSPIGDAEVSIFDGLSIRTIQTGRDGLYKILEPPASIDRYAVLFFTRTGYIPEALNIKVGEARGTEYSIVLKRGGGSNKGFVIGVIYRPIRGGKIEFENGIHSFGKNKEVRLERNGKEITGVTNADGHFLFEVSPGRYLLYGEGVRRKEEVMVSKGQTVIRNLRSGMILVD